MQRFFAFVIALALGAAALAAGSTYVFQNAVATGRSAAIGTPSGPKTFQAWGSTTAGTGTAVITVDCSNNGGQSWDTLGTVTLVLGTATTSNSFQSQDRCVQISGNVSTLTGTSTVYLLMGY
jgi:hypothetical protein